MQNLCSKIKAATLRVTALIYLRLGNASSDNSLKKSCSKITLIRISKRTSKLLRLKML
jgi:hypothetical protein